jgi:hypothetical protein
MPLYHPMQSHRSCQNSASMEPMHNPWCSHRFCVQFFAGDQQCLWSPRTIGKYELGLPWFMFFWWIMPRQMMVDGYIDQLLSIDWWKKKTQLVAYRQFSSMFYASQLNFSCPSLYSQHEYVQTSSNICSWSISHSSNFPHIFLLGSPSKKSPQSPQSHRIPGDRGLRHNDHRPRSVGERLGAGSAFREHPRVPRPEDLQVLIKTLKQN